MMTLKEIVQSCKDENMSKAEAMSELPTILIYYVQTGELETDASIEDLVKQASLLYD